MRTAVMSFVGLLLASTLLIGCQSGALLGESNSQDTTFSVRLDTTTVQGYRDKAYPYRATQTRLYDLLHTKLDVRFDWEQQHLLGKATLRLTPYFYPTDSLVLDAKGFDIHQVALVKAEQEQFTEKPTKKGNSQRHVGTINREKRIPLGYSYSDSMNLHIELDSTYTRQDTVTVFIDYTAKPEELPEGGSDAIESGKGLYFINPLGKKEDKPKQIWTQGETEANSRWFPTIDAPNERCSQEMYITVESQYETLSNGEFVYSTMNEDGTRTDYWRQNKPHAPYLFMMAIGKYAVVKDSWNGINVDYYVEPDYKEDARAIFGNTPAMLSFYSDLLDYPYPWDKYSQVIVRDFVAGAMENTSASVFMERVQATKRELIDRTWDGIIAHELIHHWFGDLVTCESWSNLALNESFATYGEYLWFEHHFGRDRADYHQYKSMNGYLRSSRNNQRPIIDYHYRHREDMFDAHSYNKGGHVLHMLREKVGDEAFFESLEYYLKENEYSAVEIDELRMAFEEVTGKDLSVFFNQWFLSPGHPVLDIQYGYNDSLEQASVAISQEKSTSKAPVFTLPVAVDIYQGTDEVRRHTVTIDSQQDTFRFAAATQPELINVDAEKKLLCEKNDHKTTRQYIFQYNNAPLFLDRWEAVQHVAKAQDTLIGAQKTLLKATRDSFWGVRRKAIRSLKWNHPSLQSKIEERLHQLALTDPSSNVRAQSLIKLGEVVDSSYVSLYQKKTQDSSYKVIAAALHGLSKIDSSASLVAAGQFKETKRPPLLLAVASIYARNGTPAHYSFFEEHLTQLERGYQYRSLAHFTQYLLRLKDLSLIQKGAGKIADVTEDTDRMWLRTQGVSSLIQLKRFVEKEKKRLERQLDKLEDGTPAYTEAQKQLSMVKQTLDSIEEVLNKVQASGKDS